MKVIYGISVALLLSSCFPSMEPKKKVLKIVETDYYKIEWFNHSSAYADTPDFITITQKNKVDTICVATNITNFEAKNSQIFISFSGTPKKYTENIYVKNNIGDYIVFIDTLKKSK